MIKVIKRRRFLDNAIVLNADIPWLEGKTRPQCPFSCFDGVNKVGLRECMQGRKRRTRRECWTRISWAKLSPTDR